MGRRERSREEWEREFREDQYNITPAGGSRVGHIMAKRSSTPAPVPDFAHLARGVLSGVLIALAVQILASNTSHKIWLGLTVLAAGCCLGATSFRWKRKSD
jgi:uncharacterized membrane protein YccC